MLRYAQYLRKSISRVLYIKPVSQSAGVYKFTGFQDDFSTLRRGRRSPDAKQYDVTGNGDLGGDGAGVGCD
jgi:hypothetical protein